MDVIHTTIAQNLSSRLKGGEFVRLTTGEFVPVQWASAQQGVEWPEARGSP